VRTIIGCDAYGNLTSVTGARGNAVTATCDAAAICPYTVTNALGCRVATAYDLRRGKLLWQTVPSDANAPGGPESQPRLECRYEFR